MKKILLFLVVLTLSVRGMAQSPKEYIMYSDSAGYNHIATNPLPQVAISGYYNNLINLPTMNSGVTRPINSTTFTVSSLRTAIVFYTLSISCTATIGSSASGTVSLQYSTNSGSTWTTVSTVGNSNTVTLAVALNSVQVSTVVLCGVIPSGALVKMVSTISGTTTTTYISGQEYY